jgi:hypothetical protein
LRLIALNATVLSTAYHGDAAAALLRWMKVWR